MLRYLIITWSYDRRTGWVVFRKKLKGGRTLKKARYENFGGGNKYAEVAYEIFGDRCVFCGITPPHKRTSTINAAESILQAIADQEGVPVTNLRFFDLQTQMGYNMAPGLFEFDELVFTVNQPPDFDAIRAIEAEIYEDPGDVAKGVFIGDTHSYIRAATGGMVHREAMIVVDNSGSQELLRISRGNKYSVWARSTIPDN